MVTGRESVRELLRLDGVVLVREHPALSPTLSRMGREGVLAAPVPGVYVAHADLGRPALLAYASPAGTPTRSSPGRPPRG